MNAFRERLDLFDGNFAPGVLKYVHTHHVPERFKDRHGVVRRAQTNVRAPDTNHYAPVLGIRDPVGVVWKASHPFHWIATLVQCHCSELLGRAAQNVYC